jgi:hypothetical protein
MPNPTEQVDVVIVVDTHTDTHTAAAVSAAGAVPAGLAMPADELAPPCCRPGPTITLVLSAGFASLSGASGGARTLERRTSR